MEGVFALVLGGSNTSNLQRARCVGFCLMSSGWFDCIEPPLSTFLPGKQGMWCACAPVRGSDISNLILIEPPQPGSKVWGELSSLEHSS